MNASDKLSGGLDDIKFWQLNLNRLRRVHLAPSQRFQEVICYYIKRWITSIVRRVVKRVLRHELGQKRFWFVSRCINSKWAIKFSLRHTIRLRQWTRIYEDRTVKVNESCINGFEPPPKYKLIIINFDVVWRTCFWLNHVDETSFFRFLMQSRFVFARRTDEILFEKRLFSIAKSADLFFEYSTITTQRVSKVNIYERSV